MPTKIVGAGGGAAPAVARPPSQVENKLPSKAAASKPAPISSAASVSAAVPPKSTATASVPATSASSSSSAASKHSAHSRRSLAPQPTASSRSAPPEPAVLLAPTTTAQERRSALQDVAPALLNPITSNPNQPNPNAHLPWPMNSASQPNTHSKAGRKSPRHSAPAPASVPAPTPAPASATNRIPSSASVGNPLLDSILPSSSSSSSSSSASSASAYEPNELSLSRSSRSSSAADASATNTAAAEAEVKHLIQSSHHRNGAVNVRAQVSAPLPSESGGGYDGFGTPSSAGANPWVKPHGKGKRMSNGQ